jgi:uncharacterized damage-inducible protein DinB
MQLEEILEGVRRSRRQFFRHVEGLTEEQALWKPYPECKSVRETLVHLIHVDRAALDSLKTGTLNAWGALVAPIDAETQSSSISELQSLLEQSHTALLDYIATAYASLSLDDPIPLWGSPTPLGRAVPYLSSEDFYHSGQVAFIRQATDPSWDYYAAIYGNS